MKKSSRQKESHNQQDIPALERLIASILELNRWQSELIQETARRLANLSKSQKTFPGTSPCKKPRK